MNTDRRTLLSSSLALGALTAAGRVFAAPTTSARLLVVFLRGAYDAANIVIPTDSDFYYQSRPTLAIARPNPADPKAALPLDGQWSLHPALTDSLYPLWRKRQIAFVPYAGTDDMTRSHFETQDTIEMGQPVGGSRNYRSGFMGRLVGALGGVRPIAFCNQTPLIFHGAATPTPNLAINAFGKPNFDPRQEDLIEAMYRTPAARALAPEVSVQEGFEVRQEAFTSLQQEMSQASRGAAPPKGFQLQAQRIGALMRDRFNLAFLDVGGWDTHTFQGGAEGPLANKIGDLGRGLAAFAAELGPRWDDTVVIVVSEFGRTFHENGDKGTDHGHGSVYWVMGGGINGGRIAGPQVKLAAETLNQGRDLPMLTDYRSLIGGVFQRVYGLDRARLQTIFPGAAARDLQLV